MRDGGLEGRGIPAMTAVASYSTARMGGQIPIGEVAAEIRWSGREVAVGASTLWRLCPCERYAQQDAHKDSE
jgi:hypothetical protein